MSTHQRLNHLRLLSGLHRSGVTVPGGGLFTMDAMLLKPKAIPLVLEAANEGGIHTTLCAAARAHPRVAHAWRGLTRAHCSRPHPTRRLVDYSGNLMAYSGEHAQDVVKIGAIACNVWRAHSTPAEKFGEAGTLRCLVIDLEQGRLAVAPTTDHLVICRAAADTPIGLVKAKAQAVAAHLEHPLSRISRG